MKYALVITTLVLLWLLGTPAPATSEEPGRVPWEPKGDTANVPYWGTVTEITKGSITIQFPNKKLKPKSFPVSEILVAGKIPKEPRLMPGPRGPRGYFVSPSDMYRLTDVKVGDWVLIHYARLGGADICDHICIQKRPGGRVPPLAEEAENLLKPSPGPLRDAYIPYHEEMNAYWDLEDKGIPFPAKFGKDRRWPVAPQPHEVKLGPPTT